MAKYSIIFITTPDRNSADKIANALLEAKLAACLNIIKDIDSFFWWQGKIDSTCECLLMIKTRGSLFNKITKLVTKLHPYEVPEIISLGLENISAPYRKWLDANIRKSD